MACSIAEINSGHPSCNARRSVRCAVVLLLALCSTLVLAAPSLHAGVVYFEKDFSKMGNVPNTSQGICSAAANVNSFAFLWNQYPGIYDDTQLLPDSNGNKVLEDSELVAARTMMAFGWDSPISGVHRPGIYSSGNTGTAQQIWEQTYLWFEDFAPGTTALRGQVYAVTGGWLDGSLLERKYPRWDFLWDAMVDMADITLGIQPKVAGTEGHAVTLTGLAFDDLDGDGLWSLGETPLKIGYLDPNKPSVQTWADVTFGGGSRMEFTWWQTGTTYYVYRAYTETPLFIPGDANGDGIVDDLDAVALSKHWGMGSATWAMGDFDGDDIVGAKDAAILAGNWGRTSRYYVGGEGLAPEGTAAAAAVPEPSIGALLVGLLCLACFRRRGGR
ncbi:MAG: hypothetical protein GX621_10745 [Pirellulaceae bacterium]|nr:hypothetical protein [Pirellulaceae bacterium]